MRRVLAKLTQGRGRREFSERTISNHEDPTDVIEDAGDQVLAARLGLFRLDEQLQDDQLDGKEIYNIDIVAIHGLNGDAERTWTHENGTFWLRDLLPMALPGARIFSYGYPSQLFFNRSVAGIRDFAMQLLQWLADERRRNITDNHRPIVFISHSLGGIVFKEAMIIAKDRFRNIWLSSKGVVFMGTPHRGSASAGFAKTMGNIANLAFQAGGVFRFNRGVQTALLEDLVQNSRELTRIADDFAQRANVFRIISFYETNVTPPLKNVIVEKSSAVIGLPNEQPVPLWANHRDLCRYPGKSDPNYLLVIQALQKTAAEIRVEFGQRTTSLSTDHSYDEFEKACVSTLNMTDTSGYESGLERQAEGTLGWLRNKREYASWMDSDVSRLLWVTGPAGCGKTTMALYVMRTLEKYRHPGDVVCRFFCDENEPSHDVSALLRALIFQIVTRRRKLLRVVRKASDRGGMQILRQFDALWDIFVQIACDSRVASISVIIDGIEGYDRKTQTRLIGRISELLKSEPAMRVKFFITSRPTAPAFQSIDANSGQVLVLRLENEQQMIGEDVNMLIHQRLEAVTRRGNCKPSTRDELEKILISKAGRTFLWVSLVLPLLEDRLVLGPTDIESIAAQLPPDLALIYERLLYLISLPDRELVGRLLRLIVVSARPLSGEELSILMAIAPEQRSVASLQDDRLVMDSRMILAALGPLVRVCDSKISLVHPSLQEYLINLSRIPHPLSEIFGVDVQRDTSTLVSACIHYLSLEEFGEDLFQREDSSDEDSLLPEVPKQTPGDKASTFAFDLSNDLLFQDEENRDVEFKLQMARRYKLFDYAALHWATDFLRCGGSTYQVGLEAVSVICGYDRVRLTNWLLYFWISKGLPGPCVPANPLIVACYFGHINHLLTYLDTLPRPHDGILWDCLFWSAREGHTSCVKAILRQRTIRPTPGILPLHAAAQYGHLEPILALIEDDRIDVNSQDNRGHTALSLASANGHADIISALLSHKSIDPNRPDTSNYTPVFWAAVANSERAISYFLTDPRVDLDHVDKEGRTTLSWAAEDGAVGVVKGLLRSRRVTVGHKDIKGRTPISYAAQHGHLELVHLFLKSQSRVASAQDRVGRNAHSWAASQPSSHVLHELLRYNSDGADVEDKDGWAALAWAINPPGYHDNVAELLHTGTVDINRKDKIHGRTPLSWAASYGFLSIARTLSCTRGILLDSRDTSGRTPLSHAAGNGNIDVVSLLLSCDGVDINSQDHNGRTPLSWAAREGSCEAIASLLSHSPIDCSIRDALNRLPYEVALAYRQDRAANILQAHSVEGG